MTRFDNRKVARQTRAINKGVDNNHSPFCLCYDNSIINNHTNYA